MAVVHGKDSYFMIATTDITTFCDSVSLSRSGDTADSTTMGAEAKTFVAGLTEATISIGGKWDGTAATGVDDVLNALVGAEVASTFAFGPQSNTVGNVKYSGSCFLTSFEVSAPLGDVVAFTAEFQVTGEVTVGNF